MRASARAARTSVPAKPAGLLAYGSGSRCRSPPNVTPWCPRRRDGGIALPVRFGRGGIPRFQLCELPRQKPRLLRFFPEDARKQRIVPRKTRPGGGSARCPQPHAGTHSPGGGPSHLSAGAQSRATCVFSPPVPRREALPPALLSYFIDKTTSEFSARHGGTCRTGPETASRRSGSPIRGSPGRAHRQPAQTGLFLHARRDDFVCGQMEELVQRPPQVQSPVNAGRALSLAPALCDQFFDFFLPLF